jgi:hypothetical protein
MKLLFEYLSGILTRMTRSATLSVTKDLGREFVLISVDDLRRTANFPDNVFGGTQSKMELCCVGWSV